MASSSLAALLIGGGAPPVFAASCTHTIIAAFDNPGGHTTANVCVQNTSFSGSITNEGTISPSGITFTNGTISGQISSSGTIAGGISLDATSKITSSATAIKITGATFTGGISNAGTVSAGTTGIIVVSVSSFGGGITNSGTISAGNDGIEVNTVSTFAGGISNSGTISARAGIFVATVSNFSAGISNSGTISANDYGILFDSISSFSGGISNSGTITAGVIGIYAQNVSSFSGGISNSGTIIAAALEGIHVANVSSFSGGISNSGTISAGNTGINVNSVTSFTGGITNSGTIIAAALEGIHVANVSTFSGGISNGGTISARTGIDIASGVTFASGSAIINSGTISGSNAAIDVHIATSPVTIDQTAGLISGAINLSSNADVLNISGGTIAGNIVGQGSSDTINFVGSGTFTYGASYGFSGINQVNVNSGTAVLNGSNSATALAVNNAGTLAGTGTITSAVSINSGGTLMPGPSGSVGTLSIAGSLTFASGATYLDTIVTTSASETNITGTATLGGANVTIAPGSTVTAGTVYTILTDTSGGLGGSNIFNSTISFDGMTGTLSYTADDVYLTFLTAAGCYAGPYPYTNAGSLKCITVASTSFTGNVGNSGTVSPSGITVTNSTITGAILDSGTLGGGIFVDSASTINSTVNGIYVTGPTFTGGISNAGTISAAAGGGIVVADSVTTFFGGISNSGTISGGQYGIYVFGVTSFTGGITNSGTISAGAAGIEVAHVSAFTGNISNSGTITTAPTGIKIVSSTINGSILDSGLILATTHGILIDATSKITSPNTAIKITGPTFTGGISNAGTLSAVADGILLSGVSTFTGNISNSGTITGATGIAVLSHSTITGSIIDSGLINASSLGILIDATSKIISATTAIKITGPTFTGGISNAGTISAATGIHVLASTFSGGITNSGTITAGPHGIYVYGVSTFTGNISNSGMISAGLAGAGIYVDTVLNFSGGITNSGTISAGSYGIHVANVSSFSGGISNSGTISAGDGIHVDTVLTFSGGIRNSGTILAGVTGIGVSTNTFSGGISNSGTISAGNDGIDVGTRTFSGGITNSGTISAGGFGIYVAATTFSGNISNSGRITATTGIYVAGGVTFASGSAIINSGTISGSSAAIDVHIATSPVTIDQTAGLISGAIKLSAYADQLNISGGTVAGNIVGSGTQDVINFNLGSGNTFTYGAAYGFGTISAVNVNSGIVILDGVNSATTVTVNSAGTLEVGDAANPSATLTATDPVDVYGTLSGHGTVVGGATIESGGLLAPGGTIGTLTISGSLVFNSGSFYGIELSPTQHSSTTVNGTPGTVSINNSAQVELAPHLGTYGSTTFAILTSTGTVSGSFDPTIAYVGSEKLNGATLSYDANDVYLSYKSSVETLQLPSNATTNEQNVANGINNYILAGNTPPGGFQDLAFLSGGALLNALDHLSGEVATGAEQGAFALTNQFFDLMLDPFVAGRANLGGGGAGGNPGLGFAPDEQAKLPADIALAYADILGKAPAKPSFDQRWGAWGAAYGGSSNTSGDPSVGSHDTSAQTYGFAAGMDYHFAPYGVAGFALAGGGTSWGLSNTLGSGYSQAFQFGGYGIEWFGPAYLAGAVSFTNHWFTTNRTALGDQLRANFDGQSYGARFEGGYRFTPTLPSPASGGGLGWGLGVTPYGAVQFQDFSTPSYSENDLTGGGLGLSYNAMNATDVRSELGARFDDPTLLYGKPLILFSRLAWAHDFVSNPALSAVFEALPGSNFVVNGAAIPQNSALTTAGLQYFLTANWSVIGKFDGEFASGSQTYAGTGTLRYTW